MNSLNQKYVPLYRKYRPQIFKDVVGQKHIIKPLMNAIKLNKIAHAFLFCGPRGTGKTSMARILAKSLNCINGPTIEPCGKCAACMDVNSSLSIDVIEIDAASNRNVEDTQNILDKIQYAPVNGKYKIYIIDEVHMLSNHAFNALLKTLEEPPSNVIFILATTEVQKVLETIISRCQRYDFRRIVLEDIFLRLKYIAEQEGIKINDEALYEIAKSSQGGMRDSLSLLDQVSILDKQREVIIDDVNELLGKISFDNLLKFANFIIDSKTLEVINLVNDIFNKGNEPLQIINNLIEFYRNILILKNCNDIEVQKNLTNFNQDQINAIKTNCLDKYTSESLVYTIERLSDYSREVKVTTNRYLWLELCLIELCNLQFRSIKELMAKIDKLEAVILNNNINNTELSIENRNNKVNLNNEKIIIKEKIESENSFKSGEKEKEEKFFIDEDQNLKNNDKNIENKNIISVNVIDKKKEPLEEEISKAEIKSVKEEITLTPKGKNNYDWKTLLGYIESIPTRTFYSNLAKPVLLSEEKVIIAFGKDIFVKQARDKHKGEPFVNAVKRYFKSEDVIIEVKLKSDITINRVINSDNNLSKEQDNKIVENKKENSHNKPNFTIDEDNKNQNFRNDEKDSINKDINKDERKNYIKENISDQEKMIIDLFDGKVIE